MGEIERACMPPCVVLVINDNLYGLMCKLTFTCRFVHWHRLGHVLVSRFKEEEMSKGFCVHWNHEERRSLKVDQYKCKELQDGSTLKKEWRSASS